MSLTPSNNYSGASYLSNIKENWLFQLFNQDSYLAFDGVDDYIDLGTTTASSSINVKGTSESGGTGISVSFLINFPEVGNSEIIFASNTTTTYSGYFIIKDSNDNMTFHWGDDSGATNSDRKIMRGSTALSANVWYHVIITSTFDTNISGTNIYINNVAETITADGTASVTTPTYVSDGKAYIAREDFTSTNYGGKLYIKNLAIWAGILDSDNRTAIYNSGDFLSLDEDSGNYNQSSNLKAYWELNNGENFIQDLTANISTGTINGATYGGFLPLAYRDTKVDDIFYHGFAKSSASIRHSIDLLKSTSKTGNISISFINGKYQGSDLSKELFLGSNNYYNRNVKVYSQLNEMSDIDECLQLYHGRLTNISHNDDSIKLSIVQKSPWDNKVVPTVKTDRGFYFPIVYGDYTKNSSTYASPSYMETFSKNLFPVEVNSTDYYYNCLIHKDIGSTDNTLHYYEDGMDAFIPLEDENSSTSSQNGNFLKTKYDLKRHFKFKPTDFVFRNSVFANHTNMIDGTTDESSSSGTVSIGSLERSGTNNIKYRADVSFNVPTFTDAPDNTSSNTLGLTCEVRWKMVDFYGTTSSPTGLDKNDIQVIDNGRYGGNASVALADSISNGTQFSTNGVFNEANNATGVGNKVTISEVTSSHDMATGYRTYNGYEEGFVVRFEREASVDEGTGSVSVFGDLYVYDIRFKSSFKVESADTTNRTKEIKKLYLGADGLTNSWDGSAISLGVDAHRDLLIRYAGMPTIEPENWTDLSSDRSAWSIRYWQNQEIDLIKFLEKLQYEFGFIHTINPSNGKSKYIWIHGTGTNNAFRAEDVVVTLKKSDISNIDISTTSLDEVITKSIINNEVHPATNKYLTEITATNSEPRNKYNIKSKENISTINLDALVSTPATTPATDKQADFYSYYSQANADVKKLIDCEIVNIQKGYLLEVGDVIKFDDMVVEPFGSDWNNYYMIIKLTRSLGKIKITAREVG